MEKTSGLATTCWRAAFWQDYVLVLLTLQLFTVHCLAEGIGRLYDTPHGVANAVFLPYVLKFNLKEKRGIHADLARYMKFATESDSDESAVEKLIAGIHEFTTNLEIPKT
jgi:alcohol dehydrogenase class IV